MMVCRFFHNVVCNKCAEIYHGIEVEPMSKFLPIFFIFLGYVLLVSVFEVAALSVGMGMVPV